MKKIEWNKVTPLSKALAMAFFIVLPFAGFCFGRWFERVLMIDAGVTVPYLQRVSHAPSVNKNTEVVRGDMPLPPGAVPKQTPDASYASQQATVSIPLPPGPTPTKNPSVPVGTFGESVGI